MGPLETSQRPGHRGIRRAAVGRHRPADRDRGRRYGLRRQKKVVPHHGVTTVAKQHHLCSRGACRASAEDPSQRRDCGRDEEELASTSHQPRDTRAPRPARAHQEHRGTVVPQLQPRARSSAAATRVMHAAEAGEPTRPERRPTLTTGQPRRSASARALSQKRSSGSRCRPAAPRLRVRLAGIVTGRPS